MNTLADRLTIAPEEGMRTPPDVIETAHGTAEVVRSAREVPADAWREMVAEQARDNRYYEVVEETMGGKFDYRYLILRNGETEEAAVQPFFFVSQDMTDGLPGNIQRMVGRVQRRFPGFLKIRILMVGCAVGEGQVACEDGWAVRAMREALDVAARREGARVIVFKDYPAALRGTLEPLAEGGAFCRVPSMPAARVELAGYKDFEDYMQRRLGKVFRKNLRRKFRAAAALGCPEMTVCADVSEIIGELYPLYRQTLARAEFSFEELTPEFLARVGREMPDKVRFFVWRLGGKVAGFNFCILHGGVLHDIDIGLDYSVAFDLHLYFVTWRDVVSWAIANGVRTYHTGPLNYDPKLHLRLDLAPLDLYIRHTSRLLNPFFRLAVGFLQPARHHPILREFPNCHEL